jgi:hypothetical protein
LTPATVIALRHRRECTLASGLGQMFSGENVSQSFGSPPS